MLMKLTFRVKKMDLYIKFFDMTTGQLIKNLRDQKGITQEELAGKTGLSVRTIQRIENGEVDPRAYTLQTIAEALEVEYVFLNSSGTANQRFNPNIWLPLLHLSGMFILVLPPLIIWALLKDKVRDINKHGADVMNFQFNMLIFLIPAGFLVMVLIGLPIVIFLGIYSTVIILINTIKVINDQPYNYPVKFRLLK